jgi:hypothetical protein
LIAFAGPWLLRNALATGNPLFPEPVRVAGHTIFHGGQGPETTYLTTIAHHLLRGNGVIAREWASLALRLYGPALFVAGAGLLGAAFLRTSERKREVLGVASICLAAAVLYLLTPLTGGGPAGTSFIIGSNLRYALPPITLGVLLAAAVFPEVLAVAGVASLFVYDAVKLSKAVNARPDLLLPSKWIAAAVVVGVAGGLVALMIGRVRPVLLAALAVFFTLGSATVAVYHRSRAEPPTALDAAVTRVWRPGERIGVLGVRDFRSIMGARLARPMVTFAAGGRADELPIVSPQQLDRAIEDSGVRILVIARPFARDRGGVPTFSIPRDWVPPSWCPAGGDRLALVLVRPVPGGACA